MKKVFDISDLEKENFLHINIADTFWERFRGLMGTPSISAHTGLILVNCNMIHMFFMRYALDVVFIDEEYNIIKMVENLRPWKISGCFKAKHTLELPVGTIREYEWKVGMRLHLKNRIGIN